MDIAKLTEKLQTFIDKLNNPITPTQLYSVGTIVFFLSFFLFPFFADSFYVFMFWTSEGVTLFVIGFIWEAFLYLKKLYRSSFVASIIVSLSTGAITSTLAIVIAEQLINQATHLNPDYFDNSLRIITALSMPLVLSYLIALCLLVCYVGSAIVLIVKSIPTMFLKIMVTAQNQEAANAASRGIKAAARMSSAGILGILIAGTIDFLSNTFNNQIDTGIKLIVVLADHYQFGPCKNVTGLERFTFINDNQISVFNPYNRSFLIKDCVR